MNKFLSTFAMMLGVLGIAQADVLPGYSVSDYYITGKLDTRIDELGTNAQTGEKLPTIKKNQNGGLLRHCNFYKGFLKAPTSGCAEAFIRNGQ